ncbi:MAG: CinA family protein [Clostridiales bacterium]|nr:CinA family protein [Clostridiales bacterium]
MTSALMPLCREVVNLAARKGQTLGTAESLTGGMIASSLAAVSGASQVLMGGIVSYDPRIKRELLGVSQEIIDHPGVVSAPCALQMALGAREKLGVDLAVSATGLAGPGGGTPEIPVGTVFICVCGQGSSRVEELHFSGNRQEVRKAATLKALHMLLEELMQR